MQTESTRGPVPSQQEGPASVHGAVLPPVLLVQGAGGGEGSPALLQQLFYVLQLQRRRQEAP